MPYDPLVHHRRSVRLKGYDYGQSGDYFVTLCVAGKLPLLGRLSAAGVRLSAAGQLVEALWLALPERFAHVALDEHIVMPNHLHGVLTILDERATGGLAAGDGLRAPARGTLGAIVRAYKAVTTRRIRQEALPDFSWQASYYEHVIRIDRELERVREYITGNP